MTGTPETMTTPPSSGMPPPPPTGWTPMPPPPHATFTFAPARLATWAQGIGFLLLVAGTLVIVVGGGFPASCYSTTTTCDLSTAQGIQYSIETARILWTLGLLGLAGGSGLHMYFLSAPPAGATEQQTATYLGRRRGELLVFVLGILLLFAILVTYWMGANLVGVP